MRTAFSETLCDLAASDERIWLLNADLGYSVLESFAQRFPERYINVGVAEQNMIGVAAGLALCGKIVFTYSIANFATLRCLEQIRNDVCYHNLNVKLVAVGAGLSYGAQGYTHHGLEDLAILRSLPNLAIAAPGDPVEARLAMRAVVERPGPCYLRLGKAGEPIVHSAPPPFSFGKAIPVREGRDVALLATGGMLKPAIEASERVAQQGKSAAVYSLPWVKPLDLVFIAEVAARYPRIITIEEAGDSGGLGGAVAEVLAGLPSPGRLLRLGIPESFVRAGGRVFAKEAALQEIGIDPAGLARQILEWIS